MGVAGSGGILGGCFQTNVRVLGGDFSGVRDFFPGVGGGVRGGCFQIIV